MIALQKEGKIRPGHLEENWAARNIRLAPEEVESIAAASRAE
jgi:hypothetical protein